MSIEQANRDREFLKRIIMRELLKVDRIGIGDVEQDSIVVVVHSSDGPVRQPNKFKLKFATQY